MAEIHGNNNQTKLCCVKTHVYILKEQGVSLEFIKMITLLLNWQTHVTEKQFKFYSMCIKVLSMFMGQYISNRNPVTF